MSRMAASRAGAVLLSAVVAVSLLAGCAGEQPVDPPSPGDTEQPVDPAEPTPSETPTPEPTFRPDGSALQNLAYFTRVLELAAEDGARRGAEFADALVEAGFDRSHMEATPERTAINLEADSIQIAVEFNGSCLIGQYGNVGLQTAAGPLLATGLCLVGTERSL